MENAVRRALGWKGDSKQQFIPKKNCVSSRIVNFSIKVMHVKSMQMKNRHPFFQAFYFHLSENCHAEFIRTVPFTLVSPEKLSKYTNRDVSEVNSVLLDASPCHLCAVPSLHNCV